MDLKPGTYEISYFFKTEYYDPILGRMRTGSISVGQYIHVVPEDFYTSHGNGD